MKNKLSFLLSVFFIVISSLLFSCGGGGGGESTPTAPVKTTVTLSGTAGTGISSSLALKPNSAILYAPTTDNSIPDGKVEIFDSNANLLASGATDAEGKFSIEVDAGSNYTVKVISSDGLIVVRCYVSTISDSTMNSIIVNAYSSSIVMALESKLNATIGSGNISQTEAATLTNLVSEITSDDQFSQLLIAVQSEILSGNGLNLSETTLDLITEVITPPCDCPDNEAPNNLTGSDFINGGDLSTASRLVTLSISAEGDIGISAYLASETSTIPSTSDSGWVSVAVETSYSDNVSFSLSKGDGKKTVYVWFKNENNAISEQVKDTITLDTIVPPENQAPINTTSVNFINNGADNTALTSVTLAISASDDSGVTGYFASENATFPSTSDSDWSIVASSSNYSVNVSFLLSEGDGEKTIYVWFKDENNAISEVTTDSIILEHNFSTDTWIAKTSMPTARMLLTSGVVNGKIYAIGGWEGGNSHVRFSTVEEYDPVTDTWVTKTSMPTARESLTSSVVNGKIYTIGGWWERSTVEEYDPGRR